MAKRTSKGTRALLEEMGDLGSFAEEINEITGGGLRVVEIVLDRIRPDPAQPRRVLPEVLRDEFLSGLINARQALDRWEALVAEEAARRGRPRPDWKALLERNPEDRGEDALTIDPPGQPGPEEELLRSIVSTAATIRHGGQVSPITVMEVEGSNYYRIETGERRFWAHHWLNIWLNGFEQIHCIIVPQASPWRQAAENTSREELTAMALARQLARLLLDLYEIRPDYSGAIPNDWYRQALDFRVPRGEGENLRSALGGIERSHFSRIQDLLSLPDPVWELADRYRLEEKRLRYILKVKDPAEQLQFTRFVIENGLSADRIQQIVEADKVGAMLSERDEPRERDDYEITPSERVANRWPAFVSQVPKVDVEFVADQWVRKQKPAEIREQVAALRRLLDAVERRVK